MNDSHIAQESLAGYVDIILPVYHKNNLQEIKNSLESIFNQSYSKILISIVIDGIVKEDIINYLNQFTNLNNFKITQIPKNLGLAKVLNIAIKESKCEYIARMDADDISIKDRISKQVKFMDQNLDIDILGTSIYEKYGEKFLYSTLSQDNKKLLKWFSIQNPVFHPTVLFRATYFKKAGYYPSVRNTTEDSLMWLQAFIAGAKFSNLKDPLYIINIDDRLLKRRKSFESIITEFKVRIKINKALKFGFHAYFFIIVKSLLLLFIPTLIIRLVYRLRAKISGILFI